MKKYFILIWIFLPTLILSQSAFSTIGSIWKYEFHTLECKEFFVAYKIENSIQLAGKECYVMNAYVSSEGSDYSKHPDSLILWETNNEVYFWDTDSFYLFYDFDMQIGDSLNYNVPKISEVFTRIYGSTAQNPIAINLHVQSIDTLSTINNEEHIAFSTNYAGLGPIGYTMGWIIPGIGSTGESIVGQYGNFVGEGCGAYLSCHLSDHLTYGNASDCDLVLGINDSYTDKALNIYPNPVTDKLYFENWEENWQYTIIDLNGQLVKSGKTQKSIDMSDLNAGLYILQTFTDRDFSKATRIIKN